METSTVLTIIGIIASVIFGGTGIYIVFKRRYSGEITFVKEDLIGLFDSIIRNLPELSILYNEEPVGQGLVLLKGAFLNTGSKDIAEVMVEEKLSLNLPKHYKWLTGKVVETSPKVQAILKVSERNIILESGLFRCNEYIRFEALTEVPINEGENLDIEEKLEKALTITHRIADTKKVKMRELPDVRKSFRDFKKHLILPILVIILSLAIPLAFHFIGWPAETNFLIHTNDNKTVKVRLVPRLDGTVKVIGVDQQYKEIVNASDFFQREGLKPEIVPARELRRIGIPIAIVYLSLGCLVALLSYIDYKRARKLHKLLSLPV